MTHIRNALALLMLSAVQADSATPAAVDGAGSLVRTEIINFAERNLASRNMLIASGQQGWLMITAIFTGNSITECWSMLGIG